MCILFILDVDVDGSKSTSQLKNQNQIKSNILLIPQSSWTSKTKRVTPVSVNGKQVKLNSVHGMVCYHQLLQEFSLARGVSGIFQEDAIWIWATI